MNQSERDRIERDHGCGDGSDGSEVCEGCGDELPKGSPMYSFGSICGDGDEWTHLGACCAFKDPPTDEELGIPQQTEWEKGMKNLSLKGN